MLQLKNISKSFQSHNPENYVIKDLNLEIKKSEFFSLLGPSGCGKSTLMRIIAGLETATSGNIIFDGQEIGAIEAQRRPFHMVFQKYALFPHMNVFENVAFGLRIKKTPLAEIKIRVDEILNLVSLTGFSTRLPETLSGGQQQRVALARALVNKPQILLLDEPLSALDLKLRSKMQTELKLLQQKTNITFIFVTHDQSEALALSDRIAVMNAGKIEQIGTPKELYEKPSSLFVADFIGESSFIKENSGIRMLRPENVHLASSEQKQGLNYEGNIIQTSFRGTDMEILVQTQDSQIIKFLAKGNEFNNPNFTIGKKVQLMANANMCPYFKEPNT